VLSSAQRTLHTTIFDRPLQYPRAQIAPGRHSEILDYIFNCNFNNAGSCDPDGASTGRVRVPGSSFGKLNESRHNGRVQPESTKGQPASGNAHNSFVSQSCCRRLRCSIDLRRPKELMAYSGEQFPLRGFVGLVVPDGSENGKSWTPESDTSHCPIARRSDRVYCSGDQPALGINRRRLGSYESQRATTASTQPKCLVVQPVKSMERRKQGGGRVQQRRLPTGG
jgi:hypothetical protein